LNISYLRGIGLLGYALLAPGLQKVKQDLMAYCDYEDDDDDNRRGRAVPQASLEAAKPWI